MKKITHAELLSLICSKKGSYPIGIESITDTRAKKTGNPYGKIFKHSRSVGFVGVNYEASVNREAERQGENQTFEAEPLSWGQWKYYGKVIEHKGEYYLRVQTTPGQRDRQQTNVINYLSDTGEKLDKNLIKPFLPPVRESNKQQEETGINRTIFVKNFSFKSIKKIRLGGKTYLLES